MRPCLSCASAARVLGGVCTYERLRGASALGESHMRTHAHTEGSMDSYLQHHSIFGRIQLFGLPFRSAVSFDMLSGCRVFLLSGVALECPRLLQSERNLHQS